MHHVLNLKRTVQPRLQDVFESEFQILAVHPAVFQGFNQFCCIRATAFRSERKGICRLRLLFGLGEIETRRHHPTDDIQGLVVVAAVFLDKFKCQILDLLRPFGSNPSRRLTVVLDKCLPRHAVDVLVKLFAIVHRGFQNRIRRRTARNGSRARASDFTHSVRKPRALFQFRVQLADSVTRGDRRPCQIIL